MIHYKGISKVFKSELLKKPFVALDDVSFSIPEGEIIGFLGANGAGKTTLIKITMDFIRSTKGEIQFDFDSEIKNKFSQIGYLPERPFFYPHLTGREFTFFMGELSGLSRSRIAEQIEKWAPRFKIDFALDRKIKTYSKGMLQRVGFMATLLHDPKLIILDEPLSGVDPIGRKELKDIIVEVNKLGTTVFFSSHIVSDVQEICDSVIFLKEGKLAFKGSIDELINNNKKQESKIYFEDNGKIQFMQVSLESQSRELKKMLEENKNIISVEPNRPTLEEIFYDVK